MGEGRCSQAETAKLMGITRQQAHRLVNDPKISEAIRRQQNRITEAFEVTVADVMNELKILAFARMGTFMKRNADGHRVPNLDDCTDEELAAVQSVEYEEEVIMSGARASKAQNGPAEFPVEDVEAVSKIVSRRTKFKLYDKEAALIALRKHLGGQFDAKNDDPSAPLRVVIEGGLPD